MDKSSSTVFLTNSISESIYIKLKFTLFSYHSVYHKEGKNKLCSLAAFFHGDLHRKRLHSDNKMRRCDTRTMTRMLAVMRSRLLGFLCNTRMWNRRNFHGEAVYPWEKRARSARAATTTDGSLRVRMLVAWRGWCVAATSGRTCRRVLPILLRPTCLFHPSSSRTNVTLHLRDRFQGINFINVVKSV